MDLDLISAKILDYLTRNSTAILSGPALNYQRTVADAVQSEIAEKAMPYALANLGIAVKDDFSRRAMEDLAFSCNNEYYAIDVKTHNLQLDFSMPNLISVNKLAKFYQKDDNNNFCVLLVSYNIEGGRIKYSDCHLKKIEAFSWECLSFGALGWGQIQITNANTVKFDNLSRKEWMIRLCDNLEVFYDEEIDKIGERKGWFRKVRAYWEKR